MARAREDGKKYLSRSEVAEIFKVSPNTITRWAEAGKLPCVRTLGGHRRYDREAVEGLVRALSPEEEGVKTIALEFPQMYGDHHVIAVRRSFLELPGVQEVWASAAFQQARVTYDPDLVSAEDIMARLEQAGYTIGDGHLPMEGTENGHITTGLSASTPSARYW